MSAHVSQPHFSVVNPEVGEVIDANSGEVLDVRPLIGTDYGEVEKLRMQVAQALAEDAPLYLCAYCHVPVRLIRLKEHRRFFFRHTLEDGRCSAVTRGAASQSEINARKYNGAKESAAHVRLKNIVAESLRADRRFSDVVVEGIWKGRKPGEWRRPDVRAFVDGIPVAFEIQLSTTFLSVIAERRNFYLKEGGLLFWVFQEFREEDSRMTQDDVFYNNNRNAFLASEQTRAASVKAGALTLDCRWEELSLVEGAIEARYRGALVTYDQLTVDRATQRVYFYDYDHNSKLLPAQARHYERETLREDFEQFWLPRLKGDSFDSQRWESLRARFAAQGLLLPKWPDDEPATLLHALYSAREKRPIGWRFTKLTQVVHQIAENKKQYLVVTREAMTFYGCVDQIKREDSAGKLKQKAAEYLRRIQARHPDYVEDVRFNSLVAFLFPLLHAHLATRSSGARTAWSD